MSKQQEAALDLLNRLKRANKKARETMAINNGYTSFSDAKLQLETVIAGKRRKTPPKASKELKTIHIVDIVDVSGSMEGAKLNGSIVAVNKEIERLKKDKSVNYIYSLCSFDYANNIKYPYFSTNVNDVKNISLKANGLTALLDAIGTTIDKIKVVNNKVHTLINIYTDGGENASEKYNQKEIKVMIQLAQKNLCTVTFIGTNQDVLFAINKLGVDQTNTLTYDGSAGEFSAAYGSTSFARASFTKSVINDENVSIGFYKEVIK